MLKNVEDGTCRNNYAHENNTLIERSKHVATNGDLVKIKNVCSNTDVIEACIKERAVTKQKIYKPKFMTICAALIEEVPMGCKDAVLLEPLAKNHTVSCLTYEKNTRKPYNDSLFLFRALVLHLQGKKGLEEETSKVFKLFLKKVL